MKKFKTITTGIILIFAASTALQAQQTGGFYQSEQRRAESAALQQALINTAFPLGLGYGIVQIFNGSTMETIGASIAVYGLVVGPSTGNFYANDYMRGGLGTLTRFGAALLLKNHTRELFGKEFASSLHVDNKEASFRDTNFIVGSTLLVGAMVYNIMTAPVSVREFNRKMGYVMELKPLRGTGRSFPVLTARIGL